MSGFRAESQEARLHLAKVKLRLDELENEYRIYREKTIETDAARNSAISSSIEKIAMQVLWICKRDPIEEIQETLISFIIIFCSHMKS